MGDRSLSAGSAAEARGSRMERAIVGFHLDDEQQWVAELECGHNQHVRHNPPWVNRPWVSSPEGRAQMLGQHLECVRCDRSAPPDR